MCLAVQQEALWRAAAFADAGADVLFIDALQSRDEMRAFCSAGGGASSVPKVGAAAASYKRSITKENLPCLPCNVQRCNGHRGDGLDAPLPCLARWADEGCISVCTVA